MNSEVKEIFLSHARQLPKREFLNLYKGTLPISTIYKWYKEVNLQNTYNIFYPDKSLYSEWQKIKETNRGYKAAPNTNKIILHYQQHFYGREKNLLNDAKVKQKLILNRKKYLNKDVISTRQLLLGFKISGIYRGYSHFSPYWIKQFLVENNCHSVYDPTGGWGHRMLGACSLPNVDYYYNDFWKESVEGINNIKRKLNIKNCTVFNNKSEKFIPDFNYDTVFTCPPYYNKERYNDSSFKSLDDFINWWKETVNCCIKDEVNSIGIVIDKENVDNISNPIIDKGYIIKNTIPLGPKRKMHYLKNENDTRDLLLTFVKSY